jgi:hypothetical protein
MFSTAWVSPVGQRSYWMLMCQNFVRFLTARGFFCALVGTSWTYLSFGGWRSSIKLGLNARRAELGEE